jgi:hypothetical protein
MPRARHSASLRLPNQGTEKPIEAIEGTTGQSTCGDSTGRVLIDAKRAFRI